MTLILSVVTTAYTIQVADRLLTQARKEYDSLANKCILFAGRDCVVSLSYTGLAFIDGKRTDDFLASCVEPVTAKFDDGSIYHAGTYSRLAALDIGLAVQAIKEGLEKVEDSTLRKHQLRIIVCGWQDYWKRKRTQRPCMIEMVKPENQKKVFVDWIIPRYWRYKPNGPYIGTTPNGHLKNHEKQDLAKYVHHLSWDSYQTHAQQVKKYLVDLIQSVSMRSDVVGSDCMSILLPAPVLVENGTMEALVEFVSDSGRFLNTPEGDELPVIYSPWQIGCNWFSAPSRIFGEGSISWNAGGTYKIRTLLAGTDRGKNKSGLSFSLGESQRRLGK